MCNCWLPLAVLRTHGPVWPRQTELRTLAGFYASPLHFAPRHFIVPSTIINLESPELFQRRAHCNEKEKTFGATEIVDY